MLNSADVTSSLVVVVALVNAVAAVIVVCRCCRCRLSNPLLHASSSNVGAGETGRGVAPRVRRVGGGSERARDRGGAGAAGDATSFGAPS